MTSSPEDRKKYIDAWERMMVDIWKEKIVRLGVIDTKQLYSDITGKITSQGDDIHSITHQFMEYGIFQDLLLSEFQESGLAVRTLPQ